MGREGGGEEATSGCVSGAGNLRRNAGKLAAMAESCWAVMVLCCGGGTLLFSGTGYYGFGTDADGWIVFL